MADENSLLFHRLSHLARRGFKPRVVYDIGANKGEWASLARHVFGADTMFYLFEANAAHAPVLGKMRDAGAIEGVAIALLDNMRNCTREFYTLKAGDSSGASVYIENTDHYRDIDNLAVETMQTETLDHIVDARGWPHPDLVKIDVQGAELEVLKGGLVAATSAQFIIIECKLVEYNRGCPLFNDVTKFMLKYGYIIYDVCEMHYTPAGDLIEMDVIFAKASSRFAYKDLCGGSGGGSPGTAEPMNVRLGG